MTKTEKWALKFALKHAGANVENIYYTEKYFEMDGLTNPASAEAYTDQEIAAIRENAKEGNENYVFDGKDNALIGMQAYDSAKTFWYDAENGKKIVSYAAPLILNGESGEMRTAEGETVALPM